MPSISLLKDKFDELNVTAQNMELYELLLYSDISDFKPVMEQILLGRLDIEDTRQIFYTVVNHKWLTGSGRDVIKDVRISDNIMDTIKNNIIAVLNNDEKAIIKESIIIPNQSQLKNEIATEFKKRTGMELSKEEIEMLLPIVNTELFIELSLVNPNAIKDKEHQNLFSDLLSLKPRAEL